MKIKVAIKRRCIHCIIIRRKGRIMNICRYKKHNQRQ